MCFHEFRQQFLKCASFCGDEIQSQDAISNCGNDDDDVEGGVGDGVEDTDDHQSSNMLDDDGNGYIGVDEDSLQYDENLQDSCDDSGSVIKIKSEPDLEINDVYDNSIELSDGTKFFVTETDEHEEMYETNNYPMMHDSFDGSANVSDTKPKKPNLHDRKFKKDYFCSVCKKTMNVTYYRFQYHLRIHDPLSAFQCRFCKQRFTGKKELNAHVIWHTGLKPFECKMCDHKTGSAYLLKVCYLNWV